MRIYTLLSHDGRLLPFQISSLRRYITDLSHIAVIQGPYGSNHLTSGGAVQVSIASAGRLGLELIEAPTELLGYPPNIRLHRLLAWFWENYLPGASQEPSMLIHGDLLPTRPLNAAMLLENCSVAGRVSDNGDSWQVPGTWLLSLVNKTGPFTRVTKPGSLNGLSLCAWSARPLASTDVPEIQYSEHLRWEWCDPGWIHVDKLSAAGAAIPLRHLFDEKLETVSAWCRARGIEPASVEYERLDGLAYHRTRTLHPVTDTVGRSPEEEYGVPAITADAPVERVMELLAKPIASAPQNWVEWENVREAHRRMLGHFMDDYDRLANSIVHVFHDLPLDKNEDGVDAPDFDVIYSRAQRHTLVDPERCRRLFELSQQCGTLPGDMAEVGVHNGGTSLIIALANPSKKLHAFDTFSGHPNVDPKVDRHRPREFQYPDDDVFARLQQVPNINVIKGIFPDTADAEIRYCFAHFDGDTYGSCRAFINYFWPRLVTGGLLVFDDYNEVDCPGVRLAIEEAGLGVTEYRCQAVARKGGIGPEKRNVVARKTWGGDNVTLLPFTPIRTSKSQLGDNRSLPFLKDMLDYAVDNCDSAGIVVWSNLDVCLTPDAYWRIRERLRNREASYSRRKNVNDARVVPEDLEDDYPGADLFAFRPRWWKKVRDLFPDMVISCESFDSVFMHLADHEGPYAQISPHIVYHQNHGRSYWERNLDIARQHNVKLAAAFARSLDLRVKETGGGGYKIEWGDTPTWGHEASRKGVVICGGGKYFEPAYATIYLLRNTLRCNLPIQLWHMGQDEIKEWQRAALEELDVSLQDALGLPQGRQELIGWSLKSFAITHCPFDEVYFSDADSYPLVAPEELFRHPRYLEHGALFCPDQHKFDCPREVWQRLGVQAPEEPGWETGQFLVDKRRHAKALSVVRWLDDHYDYYYAQRLLGDSFTWHVAWRAANSPFNYSSSKRWTFEAPACIQYVDDSEGRAVATWVHRINGKLTIVPQDFFSDQGITRENPRIPLEPEAWAAVRALAKLQPPKVLIEMGKYGDFLNLLPGMKYLHERGVQIIYLCREPYQEQMEGMQWLKWEVWTGDPNEYKPIHEYASTLGEIMGQPEGGARNWSIQSWLRLGLSEELWRSLPLVVENRRRDKEQELVSKYRKTDKPCILLNGAAQTSPFEPYPVLRDYLRDKFGDCEIIELTHLKADQFRDLLGLYGVASVLVTVDTGTLHLGYVDRLPTVALLVDDNWRASEPRDHWKLHLTYSQAVTPQGLTSIEDAIRRILVGDLKPVKFTSPLSIPLAGDVVEKLAKAVGMDRVAKMWEQLTGRPCGCQDRKAWLNRKSVELLRMLGYEGTPAA